MRTIEACSLLPVVEDDLDPARRDASSAGDATEERCHRIIALPSFKLVGPEPPQLRDQSIGKEYVSCSASLGDLGPHTNAHPRLSRGEVEVSDVEADKLTKAQAGAEGQ
jgi:hypothetical protein